MKTTNHRLLASITVCLGIPAFAQAQDISGDSKRGIDDTGLMRISQADQTSELSNAQSKSRRDRQKAAGTLEEIIVTAQKRAEKLLDIPMSVSALSGDKLVEAGVENIQDLSFAVPSMAVSETGAGRQIITIRGIGSIRGGSSLTGIYLDEMPVTGAQDGYIAAAYADLRAVDLDRVEVLKGPQGTLFGEGAAGGVVRFITKDPDLTGYGGELTTSLNSLTDGGEGGAVQAVLNAPVVEGVLGLRLAGVYEKRAGWIDQPSTGRTDINDSEVKHFRTKALFSPNSKLQIKGLVEIHRDDGDASNTVNLLPLERGEFLQPFDPFAPTNYTNDYELYNLTATYDFGFAELLSSTSYADLESVQALGLLIDTPPAAPYYQILFREYRNEASNFTQEFRLTSLSGGALSWTVGASYKDSEMILDFGPGQDAIVLGGLTLLGLNRGRVDTTLSESWAGFADVSYEFADRFTLGGGVRYFSDDREGKGRMVTGPVTVAQENFEKWTYRVYGKYMVSENVNLYVTAGTGFRSGSPAAHNPRFGETTPQVDPENIRSYEAGTKMSLMEGRVTVNAALFYSEYLDMQESTTIRSPVDGGPLSFTANGQDAEITGGELEVNWAATDQLTLSLSGDKTDSKITWVDPTNIAPSFRVGDPINLVPEYGVAFSADYRFKWNEAVPGYINLAFNRQGTAQYTDRANTLVPLDRRVSLSSEMDFLNAAIGGEWNGWNVSVFGNNLLNEDGVIVIHSAARAQVRPRMIGLTMGKSF